MTRALLNNLYPCLYEEIMKKIEASDIFQFLGLSMIGGGVYLGFGVEWALIASGVLLLAIGFFGQKKG